MGAALPHAGSAGSVFSPCAGCINPPASQAQPSAHCGNFPGYGRAATTAGYFVHRPMEQRMPVHICSTAAPQTCGEAWGTGRSQGESHQPETPLATLQTTVYSSIIHLLLQLVIFFFPATAQRPWKARIPVPAKPTGPYPQYGARCLERRPAPRFLPDTVS